MCSAQPLEMGLLLRPVDQPPIPIRPLSGQSLLPSSTPRTDATVFALNCNRATMRDDYEQDASGFQVVDPSDASSVELLVVVRDKLEG